MLINENTTTHNTLTVFRVALVFIVSPVRKQLKGLEWPLKLDQLSRRRNLRSCQILCSNSQLVSAFLLPTSSKQHTNWVSTRGQRSDRPRPYDDPRAPSPLAGAQYPNYARSICPARTQNCCSSASLQNVAGQNWRHTCRLSRLLQTLDRHQNPSSDRQHMMHLPLYHL